MLVACATTPSSTPAGDGATSPPAQPARQAPPPPPAVAPGSYPQTHEEDCKALMVTMVPAARDMLAKRHELFPFGATMSPDGAITRTDSSMGPGGAQAEAVLGDIEADFREGARMGRYRATAVAFSVRVMPPGKAEEQDAVEVRLDHRDGYSARVLIPYSFINGTQLRVEPPYTLPGKGEIFTQ